MKDLTVFLNESWSGKSENSYERELRKLIDTYKNKAAKAKSPSTDVTSVLAKYPMEILIDKLNYTPKTFKKYTYKKSGATCVDIVDKREYGAFVASLINNNKVTPEELAKWWHEYDNETAKANWHDPAWLVKHIDTDKIWNVYNPRSNREWECLLANPVSIFYYLDVPRVGRDELNEAEAYFSDPVNHEELLKMIMKSEKRIMSKRPSFDTAACNIIKNVLKNVYVDGNEVDFRSYFKNRNEAKTRYQGENSSDEYASAIYSLTMKALKEAYGVDFWDNDEFEEYENGWGSKEKEYVDTHFSVRSNSKGSEKFVDGGIKGIKIEITDKGASKDNGSTSGVYASSFSTSYKHDFNVKILEYNVDSREYDEVLNKDYPSVTVGTDYYSGGW